MIRCRTNSLITGACMYKLIAKCSCCGREEEYEMDEREYVTFQSYQVYGRKLGYLQDLFPNVPAWIRSGAIDQFSGGFCICPDCY